MELTTQQIWQPVAFNEPWFQTSTTRLDELLPSWEKRRAQLQGSSTEYQQFLEQLKRRHAIETGVIENLYDLDRGITETFVQQGIIGALLQHDDTNIAPQQLLEHLRDHLEAVDFVFEAVAHRRPLSISFIRELHQGLTRHQHTADGRDFTGKLVQITLLRGDFKRLPNNPVRPDGIQVLYAPPEQVESEMENLLRIYNELEAKGEHPARLAAWFHHAFTQIHPFQDGNGRMARLLASLILIRHNLFPFTVTREQAKVTYISALEKADLGEPQPLVLYFCDLQREAIEEALSLKSVSATNSNFKEMAAILGRKVHQQQEKQQLKRAEHVAEQRLAVFEMCRKYLQEAKATLQAAVPDLSIALHECIPGSEQDRYYYSQTIDYARLHHYYFNRALPKGVLSLHLTLPDKRRYRLGVIVHHYGYGDTTLAIGAFLEFVELKQGNSSPRKNTRKTRSQTLVSVIPLDLKPHTLSVDAEMETQARGITSYLDVVLTAIVAQIASDVDA